MKRRFTAGILTLALILTALFSLAGCGTSAKAEDLMGNIKPGEFNAEPVSSPGKDKAITDFAVRLFQSSLSDDGNTLISPISVLSALAMTANGAGGETLAQMESVFGLSAGEINEYLSAYMKSLPAGDKYRLSLANSIWFRDDDRLSVNQEFLQLNADYYDASVYKAAFNEATLKEINDWVGDKTDGMIKDILDQMSADAVMYLINALAFDAEWEEIYNESQVRGGSFTSGSGEKRNVEMMRGTEDLYLEDGSATGFIKYYAGRRYAFAALLPSAGVAIGDYISSLTGDGLMNVIKNAQNVPVDTAIPKFESEYSVDMKDILESMGMLEAFDPYLADFTGLATSESGNIYISRVLHKSYIAVGEKGTKAGAATVVEMKVTGMPVEPVKSVILDRPFVYMLIDCASNLPLFIGTVTDMEV